MKTTQKRLNWSKGDARVKLEAALSKWKEVGGNETLQAFADTEGIPKTTLWTYVSGKQQVGARVGGRSKLTVSKMKADEADLRVLAKLANVKAAVHDESVKRLESKLVGVTEHTVGPSGLRVGGRVDFPSERFVVKHAERSPLSKSKAEWNTMREELSVEEFKNEKKTSSQREVPGDESTQQNTVQSHGEGNCG
jgi:hypothetical protein